MPECAMRAVSKYMCLCELYLSPRMHQGGQVPAACRLQAWQLRHHVADNTRIRSGGTRGRVEAIGVGRRGQANQGPAGSSQVLYRSKVAAPGGGSIGGQAEDTS